MYYYYLNFTISQFHNFTISQFHNIILDHFNFWIKAFNLSPNATAKPCVLLLNLKCPVINLVEELISKLKLAKISSSKQQGTIQ